MNSNRMRIARVAAMAGFFLIAGNSNAQWGDWGSAPTTGDTATKDSTGPMVEDGSGWGMEEDKGPQMPKRVAYKRFNPPYDSLREIIYYEGIIEDENCDFCGSDSLYWRAMKYLTKRYGKENLKKFVVEDKKSDRITLKVSIPMVVRYGNYNKSESGTLEYKLTLRFKDNRYKYQFGNFVHIESPDGLAKDATRTYHEYYMKVKKGYQNTDKYLLSADQEVKEIVEGLKKSLKEPYQPDEDDW
ncbi:MAG: DUF4468 domain-containing protein [Bacteroidetes bacterium]|nr:DUF4468 domain-containing protein [Bacteroidota bacterium]